MSDPLVNTKAALDFLSLYFGDEECTLTAISPEGAGIESVTAKATSEVARLETFLNYHNGSRNIYFTVNKSTPGAADKTKSSKKDIIGIYAFHVDSDPLAKETSEQAKERTFKKLKDYPLKPTFIIDSGNGLQMYWRLKAPFPITSDQDIESIEGSNRVLELFFDGDHCFNVDRIMRLPGTVNLPTKVKVKKGRVRCASSLLEYNPDALYERDEFQTLYGQPNVVAVAQEPDLDKIETDIDIDPLPLSDDLKNVILQGHDPSDTGRWPSRSECVFWTIKECFNAGLPEETIIGILLNQKFNISESFYEKGKGHARKAAARQVSRIKLRAGYSDKPVIEMRSGNSDECLDKSEQALINYGIEMFRYHGNLVRVINNGNEDPLIIGEIEAYWLLEKMTLTAKWIKRVGKDTSSKDPPLSMALTYLQRRGEWKVPRLTGIVTIPTLRKDGSILAESGYDEQSGLYYEPGLTKFPVIPDQPTMNDARAALDVLITPLRCFPFVPDNVTDTWIPDKDEGLKPSSSRSVTLSMFLTVVIRRSIDICPMHIIDAPEKGSGKSMLANMAAIMATGLPARMMTLGNDSEEDRKRFFSVLLTNIPVIVFDNIEKRLKGEAICTILTQETWQERTLGKSEMGIVSTNALFISTGNNIHVDGDMTRRVVRSRLDPRTENPDKRKFDFDPISWVKDHRIDMVIAALTVLRAYIVAGRPLKGTLKPMGAYEDWSLVREALVWLDQPDPAVTQEEILKLDPQKAAIWDVMEAWKQLYGTEPRSLTVISTRLTTADLDELETQLRDALNAVVSYGRISLSKLREWFHHSSAREINGRRFVQTEDKEKGTIISLQNVDGSQVISAPKLEEFKG